MRLRKRLDDDGLDAGAQTIRYHLSRGRVLPIPSVTTIWRILKRREGQFNEPRQYDRLRARRVAIMIGGNDVSIWRGNEKLLDL